MTFHESSDFNEYTSVSYLLLIKHLGTADITYNCALFLGYSSEHLAFRVFTADVCIEKAGLCIVISNMSVACLTQEPESRSSIPGPATYFRFSFHCQEGQLTVTGKSMCT